MLVKQMQQKDFIKELRGLDKNHMAIYTALSRLPNKISDYIMDNIMLVSSLEEVWGSCLPCVEYEKYKSIINLATDLWDQRQDFITYIIAHETAHSYLNHIGGKNLTKEQEKKQEKEVVKLVKEWGLKIEKENERLTT